MSMRFGGPCWRSACASVLLSGLLSTSSARASILMQEVAQWGGGCAAVACSGDLACIAMGRHVLIYSIAGPAGPLLLGRSPLLEDEITAVALTGAYAFAGSDWGLLHVFDITDPSRPVEVSTFDANSDFSDVEIVGNLAFVAAEYEGLVVLDIADPLAPTLVGSFYYGQSADGLAIGGDYAYVVSQQGALAVFGISDPAAPTLVTLFDTPGDPHDVALAGSFAFVADGTDGLTVLDISNPHHPTLVTTWGIYIEDVVLAGEYVYVADLDGALFVLRIGDSGTPTEVGTVTLDDFEPHLAQCAEHVTLVGSSGTRLVDVTDPVQPLPQGSAYMSPSADAVTIDGHYAYVVDTFESVEIVDLSDPSAPYGLACIEPRWPSAVAPVGDGVHIAIVTSLYDTLEIYDVSEPTQPVLAATTSLWSSGREITCVGDRAYIGTDQGLEIFDLSTPTSPARLGYFALDGIEALCVDDAYVYAATQTIGLAIIDVLSPEFPVLAGQVSQGSSAFGVAVLYPYAYVSTVLHDLLVVNITDPTVPEVLGTFDSSRVYHPRLAEHDGYVFLYAHYVVVVSVDDPHAPLQVGGTDDWIEFEEVAFLPHHMVSAAAWNGLRIYALTVPDLGDMNCDGTVGFGDVNPFVLALSQPAAYQNQYPNCSRNNGDLNFDGSLTVKYINRFVALLSQ